MERADPTRLTAASDAGKVIAAEIPARVITAGMTSATPDKQELQVPEQPGLHPAIGSGPSQMRAYPASATTPTRSRVERRGKGPHCCVSTGTRRARCSDRHRRKPRRRRSDWRRFTADPRGRPRTDDDAAEDNAGTRGATRCGKSAWHGLRGKDRADHDPGVTETTVLQSEHAGSQSSVPGGCSLRIARELHENVARAAVEQIRDQGRVGHPRGPGARRSTPTCPVRSAPSSGRMFTIQRPATTF